MSYEIEKELINNSIKRAKGGCYNFFYNKPMLNKNRDFSISSFWLPIIYRLKL